MLYLGHFSFAFASNTRGQKAQPWHGYFTAVAEAPDVQAALKKLEALAVETAENLEVLKDVTEIFLESCVELKTMPRTGFVAHVALEEGESETGISTTLPIVNRKYATSYHLEPDSAEEHAEFDAEPFVVVRRPRTAKKKASRKK